MFIIELTAIKLISNYLSLHLISMIHILLHGLKEKRRFCEWKEEALACTLWRTRFGRGYGPCRKADNRMKQLDTA
jgi:hypothetical protein